jgi:hypothetical protein
MTLSLAQVVDLDCVARWAPLALDLPAPNRYATGAAAILRRILYSWERDASTPPSRLEGIRPDAAWLLRYRSELEGLARAPGGSPRDFVRGASCPIYVSRDRSRMEIRAAIVLIDGLTYPLEVATSEAGAAILTLGAT